MQKAKKTVYKRTAVRRIQKVNPIRTGRKKDQITRLMNRDKAVLLRDYKKAKSVLFLLDYDGTLMPGNGDVNMMPPDVDVYRIIEKLSYSPATEVFIISGRDHRIMDIWLGDLRLNLVAEHGAYMRYLHHQWRMKENVDNRWLPKALQVMKPFLTEFPGTEIEEKELSISFHLNKLRANQHNTCANSLVEALQKAFEHIPVDIFRAANTVEIRCKGADKASAVEEILRRRSYDFILAAGNDATDEDMFRMLNRKKDYSIRIGKNDSAAAFYVKDVAELKRLLEEIADAS